MVRTKQQLAGWTQVQCPSCGGLHDQELEQWPEACAQALLKAQPEAQAPDGLIVIDGIVTCRGWNTMPIDGQWIHVQ